MRELRAAYVVPALHAADEAKRRRRHRRALGAAQGSPDHRPVVCKEFAVTGIQRTDSLDATGQKLMSDVLTALERAYRSGPRGQVDRLRRRRAS